MGTILIKNGTLVNEGQIFQADIYIENGLIAEINKNGIHRNADKTIDAKDQWVMPGVIDDQVHFREPGLTHKANIYSESRAAVAGGVTSFMEMPNTVPQATTQEKLADKYAIAAQNSLANYSFFMGGTNDNIEEVLKTNDKDVCGIKLFMGSSTGNMLVDNEQTLRNIFSKSPMLIATHCEDEKTIRENELLFKEKYGENVPFWEHPNIRSTNACYLSSSMAVELAKEYHTRLHILHISTAEELALFTNKIPLAEKRITSEVCVHHLSFQTEDYETLGSKIKCNPAIKTGQDRLALWDALNNDILDIIATDHAPHTKEEKNNTYFSAPSGLPLIQHTLQLMLKHVKDGRISIEKMVEKMAHSPAVMFQIEKRGFLREGFWADICIVSEKEYAVTPNNLLYKCSWSPFEGSVFQHTIEHTIVSGNIAWTQGKLQNEKAGMRLAFER